MVPQLAVVDIQVTGMLAVNCCVWFCGVLAYCGVMVIGDTMLTTLFALPLPSVAVAVTVHGPG
jgi:TRAP-type C4-dicarboxylate transport system permease small subunit